MNHSEDFGRVTWAGTDMPCSWTDKAGKLGMLVIFHTKTFYILGSQTQQRQYQSMTSLTQNSGDLNILVKYVLLLFCPSIFRLADHKPESLSGGTSYRESKVDCKVIFKTKYIFTSNHAQVNGGHEKGRSIQAKA